jgi:glycosyltransferase involved in cell wall biosynthesis
MAAGLPVACSSRSVMPEVLGEAGVYFDPEVVPSIAEAMNTLMGNPDLRARCAAAAYHSATRYSWSNCAAQTFDFIREVATRHAFSAQKV